MPPSRTPAAAVDTQSDGRRLRSVRSRQKIIDALFRLINAGDPSPTVAAIAEEAEVSLRTAFRHINDLDSLMREMTHQLEAELRPLIEQPYRSRNWRENLEELIDRRTHVYERIMLIRRSAELRRFRSPFLMEDYQRFLEDEREGLTAVLPLRIKRQATRLAGLLLTLSFTSWSQLRLEQGLSVAQATRVMRSSINAIIDC